MVCATFKFYYVSLLPLCLRHHLDLFLSDGLQKTDIRWPNDILLITFNFLQFFSSNYYTATQPGGQQHVSPRCPSTAPSEEEHVDNY